MIDAAGAIGMAAKRQLAAIGQLPARRSATAKPMSGRLRKSVKIGQVDGSPTVYGLLNALGG